MNNFDDIFESAAASGQPGTVLGGRCASSATGRTPTP